MVQTSDYQPQELICRCRFET